MKIYARGSDSDDDSDDEVTVLMNSESKVVTITKTVSMKKTTKNKKTIMKKKKAIADELQVLQIWIKKQQDMRVSVTHGLEYCLVFILYVDWQQNISFLVFTIKRILNIWMNALLLIPKNSLYNIRI